MKMEVRQVPKDWIHPFEKVVDWKRGKVIEVFKPLLPFEQYKPYRNVDNYFPNWDKEECTYFIMYESVPNGDGSIPVSPSFATLEELSLWLFDFREIEK